MAKQPYRYAVEEKRIKQGMCPLCGGRLARDLGSYYCTVVACTFRIPVIDYHQEAGYAVLRGMKPRKQPPLPTT